MTQGLLKAGWLWMVFPLMVITAHANSACLSEFHSLSVQQQLSCLEQVDTDAAGWEQNLAAIIRGFDSRTDHQVAAAAFDVVRRSRLNHPELIAAISFQLQHQAPLYQERDKWHVLRLRAYAFVTLSETGVPESALPMLQDALLYVDERMQSVEFGAALRAAASLGTASRAYLPGILQLYTHRFAEEEFSLDHYATDVTRETATTVQIEATRALGQIALPSDHEAMLVLTAIVQPNSALDTRVVHAAQQALVAITARNTASSNTAIGDTAIGDTAISSTAASTTGGSDPPLTATNQAQPALNPALLASGDITFEDQDGRQWQLATAMDKLTLLTFFYSRCQNDGKCSATVARLAHLQKQLKQLQLDSQVKILAATFEPQFDTSERLKRYALDRGFQFNGNAAVIRFDPQQHQQIIQALDIAVGYNAGWVNSHSVELIILAPNGHIQQHYQTTEWDNATVMRDLKALLNEAAIVAR